MSDQGRGLRVLVWFGWWNATRDRLDQKWKSGKPGFTESSQGRKKWQRAYAVLSRARSIPAAEFGILVSSKTAKAQGW